MGYTRGTRGFKGCLALSTSAQSQNQIIHIFLVSPSVKNIKRHFTHACMHTNFSTKVDPFPIGPQFKGSKSIQSGMYG